jgi:hypothetical protein
MRHRMVSEVESSHNDSTINKSFLPSMQERNLSNLKSRDNKTGKQSRNISKDLFRGPNTNSYFGKSRLSTQSKSAIKSTTKFVKRLKTPDIKLGSKVNES